MTTPEITTPNQTNGLRENFQVVFVGHVDHGKSTLLGRIYADTGSIPIGHVEKVKDICDQQGKEFEYAFLFDAFIEEQEQGITIDTARTFFNWKNREYMIIDAPGHKEVLKNMISGAASSASPLYSSSFLYTLSTRGCPVTGSKSASNFRLISSRTPTPRSSMPRAPG